MNEEWVIPFADENSLRALESSFEQGPILDDGLRLLLEYQLARLGPLKIELFSREHPPPHFRVSYQGKMANFTIRDCVMINGNLDRFINNVREWHAENKHRLIKEWNARRPTDCPVGEYRED